MYILIKFHIKCMSNLTIKSFFPTLMQCTAAFASTLNSERLHALSWFVCWTLRIWYCYSIILNAHAHRSQSNWSSFIPRQYKRNAFVFFAHSDIVFMFGGKKGFLSSFAAYLPNSSRLCTALEFLWTTTCICVGVDKFLGVRKIFARISPNLSEKFLCDFFLQIFSHKDHEDHFLGTTSKQGVFMHVSANIWCLFFKSNNAGRHLFLDFQGVFQNFWQIKLFRGALAPLPPPPPQPPTTCELQHPLNPYVNQISSSWYSYCNLERLFGCSPVVPNLGGAAP